MTLPSIKETIDFYGLATKKSLGQHFLLDSTITTRIAKAAGNLSGVTAIEIGPGPGGLTRALLESDARQVIAIEKDARCIEALQPLKAHFGERFILLEEDALRVSPLSLCEGPRAIVANLPYNVGTELVTRWISELYHDAGAYQSITVMLQKEVAERLSAMRGGKDYGRLAILAQAICSTQGLMELPPGAFSPPPKVTSTVIQLKPKPRADFALDALERVTKAAFGNRRKMLRQSLKSLRVDAESWCESQGIAPTERAEQLTVEQFIALANSLS
ncbi:MAG: 16S rRNA (adenine(1518)-N(6)/adenine(1519)-N(6))-dimethyltransferase [Alphaproteobacteria bacterium]|nr:16S rRNA (adenine(1518)-N(6)/adenine(1519)-N(6))-dimethyltransferase [Alphaproteobacteria bacterium]